MHSVIFGGPCIFNPLQDDSPRLVVVEYVRFQPFVSISNIDGFSHKKIFIRRMFNPDFNIMRTQLGLEISNILFDWPNYYKSRTKQV